MRSLVSKQIAVAVHRPTCWECQSAYQVAEAGNHQMGDKELVSEAVTESNCNAPVVVRNADLRRDLCNQIV